MKKVMAIMLAVLLACGFVGVGIGISNATNPSSNRTTQPEVGAKMLVGNTVIPMEVNDDVIWMRGLQTEYKAVGVELKSGDKIKFRLDGVPICMCVEAASTGLDVTVTNKALDALCVTKDGVFDVYLKYWDAGSWTVYAQWSEKTPNNT